MHQSGLHHLSVRLQDALETAPVTTLTDGTLLGETIPSGSAAGTYCCLSDGAGSVAAVTNSSGKIANSYSYDPLGNVTSSSGSVPNPFTFGGASYDSHTGFYYTGSGYYDPATGQSFGCQDKGRYDPGEDLRGEDENPACGGICTLRGAIQRAPNSSGAVFTPDEETVGDIGGGGPIEDGSGGGRAGRTTVDGTPYDDLISKPNYAYRVLNDEVGGLNRGRFGKAIHIIKAEARPPLGPRDNLLFGYGGEVYDARNGEYLDNILDVYYRAK